MGTKSVRIRATVVVAAVTLLGVGGAARAELSDGTDGDPGVVQVEGVQSDGYQSDGGGLLVVSP